MLRFFFFMLVMVLFSGPVIAQDSAQDIAQDSAQDVTQNSAQNFLRYTYINNPDLKAARAELRAVQELYPEARALWHPSLRVEAGITTSRIDNSNFGNGDGATTKDAGLYLDQPLFRGGKTVAQTKQAEKKILAQYARLTATEQAVMAATLNAALDVVYDRHVVSLRQQTLDMLAQQKDMVTQKYQAGEVAETDVQLTVARHARARADLVTATTQVEKNLAILEQMTGLDLDERVNVQDLNLPLPDTLEQSLMLADHSAPDILAAYYDYTAEQHRADVIKSELYPQVFLSASVNRQYDPQPGIVEETQTDMIGVRATIPLYEGGVRPRVRQSKNTALRRYVEVAGQRRSVRRDVLSEWQVLAAATAQKDARSQEAGAAFRVRDNMRQEVLAGERDQFTLLEVEQDYIDASIAFLEASRGENKAKVRLAAVLGILTPDVLGYADVEYDASRYLRHVQNRYLSTSIED